MTSAIVETACKPHQGVTLAITKTSFATEAKNNFGHCWDLRPLLRPSWHFCSWTTSAIVETTLHALSKSDFSHHQDLPFSIGHHRNLLVNPTQEQPRPLPRPPKHPNWGWILAIIETSPQALLAIEKKRRGTPSSSWVPSLFWALAWACWSSSNQHSTTSKYRNKASNCGKGKEFTSWLAIVCVGDTSTSKWRGITYYTLWNPKSYILQEMKSKCLRSKHFSYLFLYFFWCYSMKFLLLICAIALLLLRCFEFVWRKYCCRLFAMDFNIVFLCSCI